MIKNDKTRIYITFTKKKAEWLQKCAQKANMSLSQFCNLLINKNFEIIKNTLTEDEFTEIRRILKTPWLD